MLLFKTQTYSATRAIILERNWIFFFIDRSFTGTSKSPVVFLPITESPIAFERCYTGLSSRISYHLHSSETREVLAKHGRVLMLLPLTFFFVALTFNLGADLPAYLLRAIVLSLISMFIEAKVCQVRRSFVKLENFVCMSSS